MKSPIIGAVSIVFNLILVNHHLTQGADVQFKLAPATLQIKSSLTHHAKHSQQLLKQPIDQQVQQHLHQFQLQQQLSSPQPLMSSVATLVPSSMTPTLITATGSPLGTTTSSPISKIPVTSMSPLLASSLITTSSASSASSSSSKASRAVSPSKSSNTYDWDLIYKVISRFTDLSNISQGIKRSIAGSSESSFSPSTLNSLLYGISMAAGLAVGVSIADSPMVSSFLNRVDHRFLTRSSNRFYGDTQQPNLMLNPMANSPSPMASAASSNSNLVSASPTAGYFGLFDSGASSSSSSESKSLSDPIVQRNVAGSKDGKDHYHHVVHYHIPYPLSVGALETAKSSYPNIPWFSSDSISHRNDHHHHQHPHHNHQSNNGQNSKMSILTGYLGPFFGYNGHTNSGNSLKDTLASRISSLPFIGSSIIGSNNNNLPHGHSTSGSMASPDYYTHNSNSDGQHKNSYLFNHRNPDLGSGNGDRYNYNYNGDNNGWQGRDHNHTSYFSSLNGNSGTGSGNGYGGAYDYSSSSFGAFNDQSDHGIRRNDPYQVFSDSEYFKSLTHGQSSGSDQKVTTTKKKSGGRKNRPRKPTMDELIYTGNSSPTASASASSGVNLLDQSSTSSPSSTSSTLSDLLTVTNS